VTTSFLHGVETIEQQNAIRPVPLSQTSAIFIVGTAPDADPAVFPLNTCVLLSSQPTKAASLGHAGTLSGAILQVYSEAGAQVIVVRVADVLEGPTNPPVGAPAFAPGTLAQQMALIIGDPLLKTGVYAAYTAIAQTGVKPKTFIAPGFTSQRPNNQPNPVVAALLPIANSFRGRIYMDCPSDSQASALAARTDWGSRRITCFYPACLVWDNVAAAYVPRPQSPSQAGLTTRVHNDLGFWYSSSNQLFNGIGGVSTPVYYADGDPNSDANLLNGNDVNTMINRGGGWLRWGNRTCATDPLWTFEAVGNTADAIYDALEVEEQWMVDKPFSKQLLIDGAESINRFMRYLVKIGALVGGSCWLDPELNTAQQLQQGIFAWSIDFEPPAPLEHVQIFATRNGDYYTEVVKSIAASIQGA